MTEPEAPKADVSRETSPAPRDVSRETVPYALVAIYVAGLAVFCVIQRRTLFEWPNGIVTGNLLASAIWAPLAIVHLDRLARRHHREHLALLRKQHRQIMFHVKHRGQISP